MQIVSTSIGETGYNVYVGNEIFEILPEVIFQNRTPSKAVIITNPKLAKSYGQKLLQCLENSGIDTYLLTIRAGEANKNLATVQRIYSALSELAIDRQAAIIPVGGGVVCDIGGFAAATYLRGLALFQVPTTLLAQVDASVGGKNGVDLPQGKNMVGTFFQPKAVVASVDTLKTLPRKEIKNGLAEVIKHGIIYDKKYLNVINKNIDQIFQRDASVLENIILRSIEIKADVVAKDEFDEGIRGILNFGHTVGHALESVTNFREMGHGEAVAKGMVTETLIAEKIGICHEGTALDVANILEAAKLAIQLPDNVSVDSLLQAMLYDKKTLKGNLRMALPVEIGEAKMVESVPRDIVAESLKQHMCTNI